MTSSNHWNQISRLRKKRISLKNAHYFVTAVTKDRKPVLTNPSIFIATSEYLHELSHSNKAETLCIQLMPDHLHWIFKLTGDSSISQLVRMLKFKMTSSTENLDWWWQQNFYDHRIRETESIESFALYSFLNPYRKQLIQPNTEWPYWMGNSYHPFQFESAYNQLGYVPIEWLRQSKDPLAPIP